MAAFFWIGAGANSNWGTVGNWSGTSGGASNGATPSSTSDVTFDGAGASGNTASVVAANVTILSLSFTTGYTNTVTINTAVTLTIAGNFTDNTNHSWTVNGTGAMAISAASTISSGGKTFPGPVSFSGANTKTLNGNWTISGALTVSTAATVINATTSETLSCVGLTMSAATSAGTAKIILTGGTWSGTNALTNDLDLQGTISIPGSVVFSTKTLTYISGTVTVGGTLSLGASCTLNTNGVSWATIQPLTTITITINSLLKATTFTMLAGVSITFAGTAAWSVGTFSSATANAMTVTLVNGLEYIITTSLSAFNSRTGSILLFTSDHATNQANLTLNNGASCNCLASFTRINANNGRAIWTFNGTLTTCNNIFVLTDAFPPNVIVQTKAIGYY
jgi:hypothetical protein